jgi:DNA-binding transcriptional ArsR family regulator
MRELALVLGITERQVARLLRDLREADMVRVEKRRKRNVYSLNEEADATIPFLSGLRLSDVLRSLLGEKIPEAQAKRRMPNFIHSLLLPLPLTDADFALGVLPALI